MRRSLVAAVCATLTLATAGCSTGPAREVAAPRAAAAPVVAVAATTDGAAPARVAVAGSSRIVWDEFVPGRKGIHLRTTTGDGSSPTVVYDAPRGFTIELTMDRRGRRVAFATCCRDSFPVLVVASLRGGTAQEPLRHHPEFYSASGIGWSPDNRRIAFEGSSSEAAKPGLYTIRPDGTGLRHVLDLPNRRHTPLVNEALAWTDRGILYSDGKDLRLARDGTSRRVLPHVRVVRMSGDGQWLLLTRFLGGEGGLWLSRPDGSGLRQLAPLPRPPGAPIYSSITPDHTASNLLAFRLPADGPGEVVVWPIDEPPSTAQVLDVSSSGTVTWD